MITFHSSLRKKITSSDQKLFSHFKNHYFKLFSSTLGKSWALVETDRKVGVLLSSILVPEDHAPLKEEQILSILCTLALRLEGELKVKKISEFYWKCILHSCVC